MLRSFIRCSWHVFGVLYLFAFGNNKLKRSGCRRLWLLIFFDVLHDFAQIVDELLATVLRCNLVHWLEWTLGSNLPQKQSNIEGYVWVFPKKRKMFDSRHILTPQCLHFLYCHGRLLGGGPFRSVHKTPAGQLCETAFFELHRAPQGPCTLLTEETPTESARGAANPSPISVP